jgi:hypothetical protein
MHVKNKTRYEAARHLRLIRLFLMLHRRYLGIHLRQNLMLRHFLRGVFDTALHVTDRSAPRASNQTRDSPVGQGVQIVVLLTSHYTLEICYN